MSPPPCSGRYEYSPRLLRLVIPWVWIMVWHCVLLNRFHSLYGMHPCYAGHASPCVSPSKEFQLISQTESFQSTSLCNTRACISGLIRMPAPQRIEAHSTQKLDTQPDHELQTGDQKVRQTKAMLITSTIQWGRQGSRLLRPRSTKF